MLESINTVEDLSFQEITPQEKQKRGILGRLVGPIASFKEETRNGRKYTDELWDKAFDNPIVKELFKCGGLPGEISHPVDRSETDPEKIAIMMPEPPKKDKSGQLIASVDILDTPCGKVAYQLAKYGFKFGISSRGEGDIMQDYNGNEIVDPDTYTLNAFDLVLIPACENARLNLVTEGLQSKFDYKKALNESLENANEKDRKLMEDTLKDLNIDYSLKGEYKEDLNNQSTEDNGDKIVEDLRNAVKENSELRKTISDLQEKLSVGYAKEVKLKEDLDRYKKSIITLSDCSKESKQLASKLSALEEKLKRKDAKVSTLQEKLDVATAQISVEQRKCSKLKEQLDTLGRKKQSLEQQNKVLSEQIENVKTKSESLKSKLNENVNSIRKDYFAEKKELQEKLTKAQEVNERYNKIAKTAVNKFIECKADMLGIDPKEVKRRLSENYSFDDIDKVCESLASYNLNISKLPVNLSPSVHTKIEYERVSPNKLNESLDDGDYVDSSLLELARLD